MPPGKSSFPLLKLALIEHLPCVRYCSGSLCVFPHLTLPQPYQVGIIIIIIPILEMKKPRSPSQEEGPRCLASELLSAFLPLRAPGPAPFSFTEGKRPCWSQSRGKEVSASFGIPSLLSKAAKCLLRSRNIREHQRGRRGSPQTRIPPCGKGWLTPLTSIKHLTHRRAAESHPSQPSPSACLPDLLSERGLSLYRRRVGSGARERGHGHGQVPVATPSPVQGPEEELQGWLSRDNNKSTIC